MKKSILQRNPYFCFSFNNIFFSAYSQKQCKLAYYQTWFCVKIKDEKYRLNAYFIASKCLTISETKLDFVYAKTELKAGREFFKRLERSASTRLENCWFRNQQTREKDLVKDLLHHCHTLLLHLCNEFIRFKIKFSDFSWHCWLCRICQFAKSGNFSTYFSSSSKKCLNSNLLFSHLNKKGSSEVCQERLWIHSNGPWWIRLGKVHLDKFVIFDWPLSR